MRAHFSRTTTYRVLAGCWTIAMVIAFSWPGTSLPSVRSSLSVDKLVHVGLFFGFGLLWMRALCPPSANALSDRLWTYGLWIGGAGLCFAVASEVYQAVLPLHRSGDPYDAAANSVGLVGGVLAYGGIVHWALPRFPASIPPDRS